MYAICDKKFSSADVHFSPGLKQSTAGVTVMMIKHENMKLLPQFLGIKDQLDIIDNGGNVLQRGALYQKNERNTTRLVSSLS